MRLTEEEQAPLRQKAIKGIKDLDKLNYLVCMVQVKEEFGLTGKDLDFLRRGPYKSKVQHVVQGVISRGHGSLASEIVSGLHIEDVIAEKVQFQSMMRI